MGPILQNAKERSASHFTGQVESPHEKRDRRKQDKEESLTRISIYTPLAYTLEKEEIAWEDI